MDRNFVVRHNLANDYFYFHFEEKKSFTHNINSDRFVLWIYYNNDDTISIHDKVKVIKNLADEYDLSNKGWDPIPLVQIFKASQHEISGNIIAIVFSAK